MHIVIPHAALDDRTLLTEMVALEWMIDLKKMKNKPSRGFTALPLNFQDEKFLNAGWWETIRGIPSVAMHGAHVGIEIPLTMMDNLIATSLPGAYYTEDDDGTLGDRVSYQQRLPMYIGDTKALMHINPCTITDANATTVSGSGMPEFSDGWGVRWADAIQPYVLLAEANEFPIVFAYGFDQWKVDNITDPGL